MNALVGIAGTVLILVLFLVAYTFGRRVGQSQGMRVGQALAPLQMRQQSLLQGRCLLCGTSPNRNDEQNLIDETAP